VTRATPSIGDFVVEYRDRARERRGARVVIVHLTSDSGRKDVFSSCRAEEGSHAERLAVTWALEDGTCAWRVLHADTDGAVLSGIMTDVTSAPNSNHRPGSVQFGILPIAPRTPAVASIDER
jgi:hypothetical protein